jgi:hypothetical protein
MKLIYQGPFAAVEIPEANYTTAVRGEPVDVEDPIAQRLLEQDCWTKPRSKKETD